MRVCFVNLPIEFYSPTTGGAVATIIAQTGRALLAAGHAVTVLTPTDGTPTYDVGRVVPVVARRRGDLSFPARRWSDLRRRLGRWDWPYFEHHLKSVERTLARLDPPPDVVVLFNDLYTPPHVRRVLPKAKVAVWLQNEWRTHPANVPVTAAATDVFLTCSSYIRDWTAATHGIPVGQFAVVPSGVDLDAFRPRPGYLDPRPPRVLFIGRVDPNKGPDLAADAVAALQREGLDVALTVAGGLWFYGGGDPMADPFFRLLRGKMQACGATYRGHVARPDVPGLVAGHDVVCVLSRSNEPFGLVTLEAMASGCAVVASDRGGLPEACGGAATLVDPDDLPAVTAALRSLVADPARLAARKAAAVARAAGAGWSTTAAALLAAVSA